MKTVSIVLTVHDQEALIPRVVTNILKNRSEFAKELIVVFDGCTDGSEPAARAVLKTAQRIKIVTDHAADVFETKANNIGLKKSTCDYVVLIQDDMVIDEPSFDARLLKPLLTFADAFACTGRAAHNVAIDPAGKRNWLRPWREPKKEAILYPDLVGRENNKGRDVFGIRDVVNRGPLMLDRGRLEKLNYLDEAYAPYTMDDHDLCLRAYRDHGWVCGSYVVDYQSDPEWGTTRKKNGHVFTSAHEKNTRLLLNRHRPLIQGPKHNEERRVA